MTWNELSFPRQPEHLCRVGAAHLHPAVEAETAGAHAEMVDQGQARFTEGQVARCDSGSVSAFAAMRRSSLTMSTFSA